MKDCAEFLLQMKINNTKKYTQAECDKMNREHKTMGFNFVIGPQDTCNNPGMRSVAKLLVNALWGKFGQRTTLEEDAYVNSYPDMLEMINHDTIKINSWHIISENYVEVKFVEKDNFSIPPEYISEITAAFTTSNARVRLYNMLDLLHSSQLVYCDTDSIIFVYGETDPNHRLPPDSMLGDSLGAWKDELKPEKKTIERLQLDGSKIKI